MLMTEPSFEKNGSGDGSAINIWYVLIDIAIWYVLIDIAIWYVLIDIAIWLTNQSVYIK
jgi:hypothetical protein